MRSTEVSVGKQKSQCIWMKRNEVTRESELKEEAGSAEHGGLRGKAECLGMRNRIEVSLGKSIKFNYT